MRVVGAALAVTAGLAAGNLWADSLAQRARELAQFRSALLLLETEISYALAPLPDACAEVAARASGTAPRAFFRQVGRLIAQEGLPASEAWVRSLDQVQRHSFLSGSDWEPLRRLGQALGVSGREEQLKHLALVKASLSGAEDEAARRSAQLGRVYRYAGLAASALAVLFFL